MHRIRTASTTTAVRAQLAGQDLYERLAEGAQRRTRRLRDDGEAGAQAAEYAMLGGVSAAACGALVLIFKKSSTLESVVNAVVKTLTKTITSWL